MDTKKYQVFEKIVELSSLTRAAESMGMTQSGVSHILAGLEEEFGFPLLRRSRVGTQLTPEGERLMSAIREVLRAEERLEQAAAELRGLSAGTVRVATFTSVAVHWLPEMMSEFQKLYPRVEFQLFNGDYHDVDRWLTDGSADVGFTTLFKGQESNKGQFTLYKSLENGFAKDLQCAGEVDMRFLGFAYVRNYDKRCING